MPFVFAIVLCLTLYLPTCFFIILTIKNVVRTTNSSETVATMIMMTMTGRSIWLLPVWSVGTGGSSVVGEGEGARVGAVPEGMRSQVNYSTHWGQSHDLLGLVT